MDPQIKRVLRDVEHRLRRHRMVQVWTAALGISAVGIAIFRLMGVWVWSDSVATIAILWGGVAVCGIVAWIVSRFAFRNERALARLVESACPDLGQRLLAAIDQRPDSLGNWSYLQRRLTNDVLRHHAKDLWTTRVLPSGQMRGAWSGVFFALLALLFVVVAPLSPASQEAVAGKRVRVDAEDAQWDFKIQPGDVEVERGMGVAISAGFSGNAVPSSVTLSVRTGDESQQTNMQQNLDDPLFAAFLPRIQADSFYRVMGDGFESPEYKITVFEYPRLVRSDATIQPPSYTTLEPKTIEDTLRVTVVEGSRLRWSLYLNKPVKEAFLVDEAGERVTLDTNPDDEMRVETEVLVTNSMKWELHLVDDRGRANPMPVILAAKAIENRPVELKLVSATDATVSPLEELPVAAEVIDDFGIKRSGLSFSLDGGPSTEIELTLNSTDGSEKKRQPMRVEHLVDFEQMQAEADQLLAYYFWAEDIGPDGTARRISSDIFFAEVRPFEQIFREGQSQDANQQQSQQASSSPQAQQAEELAELQKQIAVAAWNLQRKADLAGNRGSNELADALLPDVSTLEQTQREAIEKLAELAEGLPADRSPELVRVVEQAMQAATEGFATAGKEKSREPLADAARQAQAAYGAMLRLRAREFEVSASQQQRQQQQGGGAGRSQMQQQLDQLELKNDPRRYESQPSAQNTSPSALEPLQDIASRLRDLARRQTDLNERLKAAELALQMADTDDEKEEAQRQLERLREQQQDLLRDADELGEEIRDQSQQSGESQRVASEAAEQLQRTRESLREASKALENGEPSSALAAGSRAQRELEAMQEQLEEGVSGEVGQQLQQLRERAGELASEQADLQQRLSDIDNGQPTGGLRAEDNGRRELSERFQDQARRAEEVIEQMREMVRQTEESQPLVAERLYDSQRRVQEQQLSETLEAAGELLRRGLDPQATEASEIATQQIEQLDAEIQATASGVLGDPTQRMRQASDQLAELARQLASERPEPANAEQMGGELPEGEPSRDASEGMNSSGEESRSSDDQQEGARGGNNLPNDARQQVDPRQGAQEGSEESSGQPDDRAADRPTNRSETSSKSATDGGQQGNERGQGQASDSQAGVAQPDAPQGSQVGPQQTGPQQTGAQQTGNRAGGASSGSLLDGFWSEATESGDGLPRPITGDGFREWSDRLRQAEEMLGDDALRSRAAGIRDRAREMRREVIRHSREPQWSEIEEMLARPLRELQEELAAEIMRRSAERNAIVPMDRDAVPDNFSDAVRRYYEQLGAGR